MTDKKQKNSHYLAGKLLLATPGMGDPRFDKAVIYVCAHDEQGAMGLVINHAAAGLKLDELFSQLNINIDTDKISDLPVMSGGPVETARGFILHSPDFEQDATVKIDDVFSVTGTVDAMKAVAAGTGPKEMLFALGYAGWDTQQLDEEIQKNAWLIVDPDPALIFSTTPDKKWDKALAKLGVDPAMLSLNAGNA